MAGLRMSKSELTGTRIRARRNLRGLRQAQLAQLVGVSPSYMNLIEHNRRKVSAPLLAAVAQALGVDQDALVEDTDMRLVENVRAAAARVRSDLPELERIAEFTGRFPGWARVLADTQSRVEQLEQVVEQLNDRMTHDPYLGEALHEIISAVTSVQSTAAILNEDEGIAREWQSRFHRNILQDSARLAEGAVALVNYIDAASDNETGLAAPQEEVEAWLGRHSYNLPEIEAGATQADPVALIEGQVEFSSDAARALALRQLQQMQADAAAMPLRPLLDALAQTGLEPDLLAQRFAVPLDQALRRLAMLPEPALSELGLPVPGLVICDASGTLLLRRPVDGFPLPRFGGGCPLWPLYQALHSPARPIRMTLVTDGRLGRQFTAFAVSLPAAAPSFRMPQVLVATMLVVPQAGEAQDTALPLRVGGSCRTCAQDACPARREPSIMLTMTAGNAW